jgi:hypothetical protein
MALSPAERRRAIYSGPEDNLVIGEDKIMSMLWIAGDYIHPRFKVPSNLKKNTGNRTFLLWYLEHVEEMLDVATSSNCNVQHFFATSSNCNVQQLQRPAIATSSISQASSFNFSQPRE